MAEENEATETGPGSAYQPFVDMEEFMDKLKLLHYETTFCKQLGFKSFPRHYFALQTNPGEQFYAFTSLAAWLLQMAGKHFEQPQEYDDPNATISSLLEMVRGFGHTPDFPPSKLKQGVGEHCIWILNKFSDEALKAKSFSWKFPIYPEEEVDEDNVIEDDAEVTLNKVEEEMMAEEEDDFEEEENIMGLDDLKRLSQKNQISNEISKLDEIMESSQDAAEWKLEVERIVPQLKITIRTDNKDWRVHMDQMQVHQEGIDNALKETKGNLDKLYNEITRTLEKIGSREKYLNSQLEHHLHEFRSMQDQLAETKERYRQASGGVTDRTKTLAEISEELERVKGEMEERGTSMTDGAPLVKIKQAIQKLKTEMNQMDIRTGVVQHILLQAKLKEKSDQQHDVEADSYWSTEL